MKTIRKKRCIICKKPFKPSKTTQRVCSYLCAVKHAKDKQQAQVTGLKNFKDSLTNGKKIRMLIESTTKKVHKYIRERDKGKECISCGTSWHPDFEAGHFFNKKQFNGIRFNLDNIHGQCVKCNRFEDGNYAEYSIRLRSRIGDERFDKLNKKAAIAKKVPHTFTLHELKQIQQLINELNL